MNTLTFYMSLSLMVSSVAFRGSMPFLRKSNGLLARRRQYSSLFAFTSDSASLNATLSSALFATNAQLVEKRLAVSRGKQEARQRSLQHKLDRNQQIQRLIHTNSSSTARLYQLKVTVCDQLRQDLLLSGREKRGRVFVADDSLGVQTLKGLQQEVHDFFRALKKQTYILYANYPELQDDGTMLAGNLSDAWVLQSDQDVVESFARADSFFQSHASILKRPSLILHVQQDPNAPPPPPLPDYLQNLPDPNESPTISMLSFYSFPPNGIANPEDFALQLRKQFKPFAALGRIYVAHEGVNAQMSVPTNVLQQFQQCCASIPELGQYMENGINVDPQPLTRAEFAVAGTNANSRNQVLPPFTNLHVRVRNKIVADGWDNKSYQWQHAGYDMPPLEWHETLKRARENNNNNNNTATLPIVLDFRNVYETNVGRFEGAEPLGTENFRDSWEIVNERLASVPKDAPIMMYCTGGIRCVKAGAYVTQELGFTNVSRLAGGIIAYDRTLQEKASEEESMFKGTNFVFDGRLGRPITDDALGECVTCGGETSLVSNCRNENCHKRMIQCEQCRTSMMGTCSDACNNRIMNGAMTPRRLTSSSSSSSSLSGGEEASSDVTEQQPVRYSNLDQYSMGHSTPPCSVYGEIELNTRALIPSGSHMVSGAAQGRLLTQLASMTREGRVLELGTFTGYATTCLWEGALNVAAVTNTKGCRESGPYVLTMERDLTAYDVAVSHLEAATQHGLTENAAKQLSGLRSLIQRPFDVERKLVTLNDPDELGTCELMQVSDALATVEEMAAGRGDFLPGPFDLIFVDADKTRLIEYAEACLSSDRLLKKGGFLVVDNVLWKGLVLEASTGNFSSLQETEESTEMELRKNRRARKLANKMHRFNEAIVKDPRAEVLVLPLRDGLSVIRKK